MNGSALFDGEQLGLEVNTIQPNEAYLCYTEVTESWDSECIEWREEQDHYGDFYVREHRFPCRADANDKMLNGVIVDDVTLEVIKGRMESYTLKAQTEAHAHNEKLKGTPDYKPNFVVEYVYTLEKIRRINLKNA